MSESLQFEHAEFDQAPPQLKCSRCERPLLQSYYQINGDIACEACALTTDASSDQGSGLGRAVRATGAGFAAAVLGALLYYAVAALTGYEFGLIAVVVGFAVGSAVRWGARGRGGWRYQTLAIVLTYLAIVSTYVPYVFAASAEIEAEEAAAAAGNPADDDGDDGDHAAAAEKAAAAGVTGAAANASRPDGTAQPLTGGQAAFALGVLILILCAAPFLAGFQNIIGLVIIGFGLFEAWKLNRREELVMTGPHPIAAPPAPSGV